CYSEAFYGQAQKVRTVIADEHRAAFEQVDVLVSPTSPTVAFPLGAKTQDPLAMYLSDLLTIPSNMAGLPGLSIPCGLSEGLPVGCAIVAPQFAEHTVLHLGLDTHIHLKRRTTMFCGWELDYGVPENTRTCPVCLAHPGALPVPNELAI